MALEKNPAHPSQRMCQQAPMKKMTIGKTQADHHSITNVRKPPKHHLVLLRCQQQLLQARHQAMDRRTNLMLGHNIVVVKNKVHPPLKDQRHILFLLSLGQVKQQDINRRFINPVLNLGINRLHTPVHKLDMQVHRLGTMKS